VKPEVPEVLGQLAQTLMLDLGPSIGDAYGQSSAAVIGMLLTAAAEEWDRAAARRVEENAALRALFGDAAGVVKGQRLRRRLEKAATAADPGLRVSELARENETLRSLLIELQAHVESLSGGAARALEERIWEELRASTVRRALSFAPF
jgi:hypothetical protein